MKNSQLINVFLGLNGKEKRAINKVVVSPFFNQRQEVIDLWRYLVDHSKEGSPAFRKKQIFDSVFPGKAFDDKLLRHVSSWLLKCIEEYLAYTIFKSTPIKETLHLTQAYRHKKQEKYFQKSLQIGDTQLEKIPRGLELFYFDYRMKVEKYGFAGTRNKITEDNLRFMNLALDKYILMSKLKQACIVRSHQSIFTTKYDFNFVELLLTYIEENQFLEEPGIACYYYCYKAMSGNDENSFQALKKTVQENKVVLAFEDVEYLYYTSINFSIRMQNTKGGKYRRETFELYRTGLEDEILIKDGTFSRFAYNNIVATGIVLEEFDWLEEFIPKYKSLIHPQHRESNFAYNLAKLKLAKKEYDQALELLAKVDDKDLLANLDSKVLRLKIYFETKEFDTLTSLLSSFSVMLGRKKVVGYHKEHFQNIIRFTTRILNLTPRDKKAKEKLKQDIQEAKILGQREWLLEQLQ